MKRIYSLSILLGLTLLLSYWERQWDFWAISDAIFIALFVEILAISLELNDSYVKYRKPEWFWNIIFRIRRYFVVRKMAIDYENENQKEIFRNLINNAIENLKSNDVQKKWTSLEQLYEFESQTSDELKIHIYKSLIEAHQSETDLKIKSILMEAICHFHGICKKVY